MRFVDRLGFLFLFDKERKGEIDWARCRLFGPVGCSSPVQSTGPAQVPFSLTYPFDRNREERHYRWLSEF